MNIQVGKSAGIALLMAAALLAALFAMGVFAPAGVGAVKLIPKPTAELSSTAIDATGVTLTVEFHLANPVDSSGRAVTITLPNTVVLNTSVDDDNVTVEQGGNDVGDISVDNSGTDAIITISAPASGEADEIPAANTLTTVTIEKLALAADDGRAGVVIAQGTDTYSASIGIFNPAVVPTAASAEVDEDDANTLVVKFTAQDNETAVVLKPAKAYLLTAENIDAESSVAAQTITATPSDDTNDDRIITVSGFTDGATVTLTIDSLHNLAVGDKITLSQDDSSYETTLEVDGPTVSPTGPDTVGRPTPGVFSSYMESDTQAEKDASSTAKAGAAVRVTVRAIATAAISGGESIVITLPGFTIPSIDRDDVIINGKAVSTPARSDADTTASYYGSPESVSVSGDKVTVRVPFRNDDATRTPASITAGAYQIIFLEEAGLMAPTSTGIKTIEVKDIDGTEKTVKVKIVPSVSVKPTFVTRGGDATVTVKGVRDGTTTVYLVKMDKDGMPMMDDDGNYDRGVALGSGTADDGVVEIEIDTDTSDLKANAMKGTTDSTKDVGTNMVVAVDSANGDVDTTRVGIKPTVKLGSDTAKRSTSLKITVSDWYYGDIDMVTIGGIEAEFVGDDVEEIDVANNKAEFNVTVPATVRAGEQEVKVSGDRDDLNTTSATAKVTITALPLDVSPSNVVPNQRVTITGSGFPNSQDVDKITIGGINITVPDDSDSTSSGRVAVTVTVPLAVGNGDKAVKLTVGSRMGEGEITVPKPSIELDPAESVPGSIITVTGSGSGFAADGRVEVRFDGDIEEVGRADGSGDVHIRLEIPSDAGVGETNPVKVEVRSEPSINASADHKTPGPAITVPDQAQVGTLITISGTNFEPFSNLDVMIGGKDATPSPGPETDKNGAFEVEARVPRLSAGSHTITVEDKSTDENSVTETFDVILTPVVSTPEEVF